MVYIVFYHITCFEENSSLTFIPWISCPQFLNLQLRLTRMGKESNCERDARYSWWDRLYVSV